MKWNKLENNFFWLAYNRKNLCMRFNWMRKVYVLSLTINAIKLENDDERPHHTGTHYNFNEEQLGKLPADQRQAELNRRKAVAERSGVRLNVG